MKVPTTNTEKRGFTLIELLVIIIVIVVICVFSF
ncbi:MAG: type II secretion system protein [Akkermansia sp.]